MIDACCFRAVVGAAKVWLLVALSFCVCAVVGFQRDLLNGYWLFTIGCWLVLDIYWALAARNTTSAAVSRRDWRQLTITFLIYGLYCLPLSVVPLLGQRVIPELVWLRILGAALCAFGVGFAIWARHALGRSWSAAVTMGEKHSLVQKGPYAIVRHPIYFGFLVAVVGMIFALGELRAVALLFGVEVLLRKIGQEEQILQTTFPDEYPLYARRVKRLIPCLW